MKRSLIFPLFAVSTVALAQLEPPQPTPLVGARSLALSPDGTQIAFTYQGDVWVAPANGGRALPVTNNVEMDDNPVWSPDGRWIAYSTNRHGNWEIYVVPAEGGQTRRITWHSGTDVPSDWSPDGKFLLVRTTRDDPNNGFYALDVATGKARRIMVDMMPVNSPRYSPDGNKILYSRFGFPWVRPRYQGSAASQLWTYDIATGKREKVRSNGFQHLWHNWSPDGKEIFSVTVTEKTPSSSYIGKPIPKLTDNAARTPNIYEVSLGGNAKRMTGYVGDGPRFLTVAKKSGTVAYEQDGDIYVGKPGEANKILVTASIDDKTPQEERMILTDGASDMDVSPKGDQVAFTVRGEIWTVPVKKDKGPNADDATQLTEWEGVDSDALYAPDGKSIFFLSDREGQMRLYRMNLETKKAAAISKLPSDVGNLKLTPDKKNLSFWQTGNQGGLYMVPVDGGEPKKVFGRSGSFAMDYDWSPDGRFVAYSDTLTGSGYYYWEAANNIFVYDTTTGKAVNVTQLSAQHSGPRWSPDGKYLFFRSDRSGDGLYVLPLQPEDQPSSQITLAYTKPKDPVKVEIDWADIETRSRRLMTGSGSPVTFDHENGDLIYASEGDVWKANFNGEEAKRITTGGGVQGFGMNQDGNTLSVIKGGKLNIVDLRKPQTPTTAVAFRSDWTRDVRKERRAAYNQYYREYNRSFYDPNFHGRDWSALKAKYEKFLPSVAHRNEMATVLNMMTGELESSHSEVSPGSGNPSSQSSAHLGFLADYTYDGPGIRIKEVPARTPGSFVKSKLNAGEIVTKINGKDVRLDETLYRDVLNEETGRNLVLTVRTPAGEVREVKYRAISGGEFGNIVWNNRLEARRRYVEEKSGGKLTYVHIAGMGGRELERFNQQVWQYAKDKKGLIIDVRNNGGGNTSDRIIDVLERRVNARYQVRDEDPIQGPGQALGIPMVVMHAETSYSNAEMFPYAMKARGLATLVGMPTPGYVIYTGGFRLVDGTVARMPGTGVFRLDGSPLENIGEEPDIRVDITPEEYFAGKDPQLDKAIEALLRKVG